MISLECVVSKAYFLQITLQLCMEVASFALLIRVEYFHQLTKGWGHVISWIWEVPQFSPVLQSSSESSPCPNFKGNFLNRRGQRNLFLLAFPCLLSRIQLGDWKDQPSWRWSADSFFSIKFCSTTLIHEPLLSHFLSHLWGYHSLKMLKVYLGWLLIMRFWLPRT